jgi:hypothetical protein
MDSGIWGSASAPSVGAWANVEAKQRVRHARLMEILSVAAAACARVIFFRRILNAVHFRNFRHILCPERADFRVLVAKGRRITAGSRIVEADLESDAFGPRQSRTADWNVRISPRCVRPMSVAEVATAKRNSCGNEASRMRDASG